MWRVCGLWLCGAEPTADQRGTLREAFFKTKLRVAPIVYERGNAQAAAPVSAVTARVVVSAADAIATGAVATSVQPTAFPVATEWSAVLARWPPRAVPILQPQLRRLLHCRHEQCHASVRRADWAIRPSIPILRNVRRL